ncbi:FGGY family carbohydrate kinase [Nonomuraea typhae]|uniref:FGGY family carbohydrate kinase n=1 Tax=Nonomuraea typhae TaxID=2603600 RepID=UPI0012F96B6A|nr:FGGY family carbohydrate kinase [Nonomuraea typhae]
MAAICVDAGTTVIKAVGYGADGAEVASARRTVAVSRPAPGHAEQDMEAVWAAVAAVVAEVAAEVGAVDFLALTAQGDGCWLVGPDGAPTGPAILWNDARAAGIVRDWTGAGVTERAFRVNGSTPASGLPSAILAWLGRHDPGRIARSAAALNCGGWLFARLTGRLVTDYSSFTDLLAARYSPELLALFGVEWAERLLPELRLTDRVEPLTETAAARLGLPPGLPVVLAPYDIAATALGAGAVSDGQACAILGTTLCTEIVTDTPSLTGDPVGITVALGSTYLRALPTFAGTEVIHWACRLLGLSGPAELADLAARGAPGAEGLVFLPYLSPAGERSPFSDPLARGSFLGLSLEHGREHIARAVLEGLALVIGDCLAAAGGSPRELRVCGGGAASALWVRLIADVTGLPVRRAADTEAGARGAHLTGLVATGAAPSLEAAAAEHVRPGRAIEPSGSVLKVRDFVALREAASATWPLLAGLRDRS